MDPMEVPYLVDQINSRWKLIVVGDAAMAPGELLGTGPWAAPRSDARSSVDWLVALHDRFEKCVWLNPDPPQYWTGGTCRVIGEIFPMFHLTIEGLTEAMAHLSKGAAGRTHR
jgi:hypothetical protein